MISGIVYFREIVLKSPRNLSETIPGPRAPSADIFHEMLQVNRFYELHCGVTTIVRYCNS